MRLIFMGSPDFAVPSLKQLARHHEIVSVYSQPPRASGRGMTERLTPVAAAATDMGIAARWPLSLKSDDVQTEIAADKADAIIVVAYGLLLPQAVLDIPKFGCLNGHASLLPRWRGAAPIQRAIEAGDRQTGITSMQMEAGLDTGPMLLHQTTDITPEDTASSLHDRLADMTADCLVQTIDALSAGTLTSTPQPEDGITYAAKINTSETEIDFTMDANSLANKIRAFSPAPGCWLLGNSGKRMKILMARAIADTDGKMHDTVAAATPGTYLGQADDGTLLVATSSGIIAISTLQPAGKKPMLARDFLNGRPLALGEILAEQV